MHDERGPFVIPQLGFGHREWLVNPMLTMSSNRLAWGIESSLKQGGQVVEKCLTWASSCGGVGYSASIRSGKPAAW